MFQILSTPPLAPSSEMLQEDIGRTVREDERRFNKFSCDSARARWLKVPCPSKVRPAAHIPTQNNETVPEENASFDEVRKTAKNTVRFL